MGDRSEGDNAGETCVDVFYAALDLAVDCDPPKAACPQMEAAQSDSSKVCVDGGAACKMHNFTFLILNSHLPLT